MERRSPGAGSHPLATAKSGHNSSSYRDISLIIMSQNLLEEWHDEQNLSIVIVRHPLSRLASVYYQKFVELSAHKSWSKEGLTPILGCGYYCLHYVSHYIPQLLRSASVDIFHHSSVQTQ